MQYKVRVKVIAEIEYEVTVDCASESRAESEAVNRYRRELPDDFQVDKIYITNFETDAEQLTFECHECGAAITQDTYRTKDEMCHICFAVAVA